jgi:hypothetical protein
VTQSLRLGHVILGHPILIIISCSCSWPWPPRALPGTLRSTFVSKAMDIAVTDIASRLLLSQAPCRYGVSPWPPRTEVDRNRLVAIMPALELFAAYTMASVVTHLDSLTGEHEKQKHGRSCPPSTYDSTTGASPRRL